MKPKPSEKKKTAKPDADGWIPHVPGDKCPCDGELEVEIKCSVQDGDGPSNKGPAELFSWETTKRHPDRHWGAIIAWRPAPRVNETDDDIVAILPTQPKKAAKKSKPKLSRKLVEQTISNLKTILETL